MSSEINAEGFIKSIEIDGRQPEFETLVKDSLNLILESFADDQVHSIYLYGSIARATAKVGTSDLDLLVVFHHEHHDDRKKKVADIELYLTKAFAGTVRDAGIAMANLDEIFEQGNQIGWGCFLKHMCSCLYGDDLGKHFPQFKPSKSVIFGLNNDLSQDVQAFTRGEKLNPRRRMALARKIIRASIGLLPNYTPSVWSTDLQMCVDLFCASYPAQANEMRAVLSVAVGEDSNDDPDSITRLSQFCRWFAQEFALEVEPYASSERYLQMPRATPISAAQDSR